MIELVPYQDSMKADWDGLVERSRNGIFQLKRDFMEYHCDRFPDRSYAAFDKGRCVAVLAGHRNGPDGWASHLGLSHGGFVLAPEIRLAHLRSFFDQLHADLRMQGIGNVRYKAMPWWLQREPAQDDLYLLQGTWNARRQSVWLNTLISLDGDLSLAKRRRDAHKAQVEGVEIEASQDWEGFWEILTQRLSERHAVKPVHSCEEIRLLANRFPDNIRLWCVQEHGTIRAGMVGFLYGNTFHVQYSATDVRGRELRALDLLALHLIDHASSDHRWFSFGTSCEDGGSVLNEGLLTWKEGFAGHGAIYEEFAYDVPGVDHHA
jgi:Acetyltransferase (GNAT) domain